MSLSPLTALSPVDGRYRAVTKPLAAYFSEAAFIRYRIRVELAWLQAVVDALQPEWHASSHAEQLANIIKQSESDNALARIKEIEAETQHDVKAVEYWIGSCLDAHGLGAWRPYVHFACTSWDINNVAFSLQLQTATREVMGTCLQGIITTLQQRAAATAEVAMLSRTHGQAASPTTMGKELANVVARLQPRLQTLQTTVLPAKMNGAVGNFNAHTIAAPQVDWLALSRTCVEQQGLRYATHTTQIEPYDDIAELFDTYRRINTILLDLARDCWSYIALDYFSQHSAGGEQTGSSTMPHKINPIDFEKAEGNLGIANALFMHFGEKLPVSRWQRDLSDSTVVRAVGAAMGHTLIAWEAVVAGLNKIEVNPSALNKDLADNWQVLGEAVQTVMRAENVANAYEQVKAFSRGKEIDAATMQAFIRQLAISDDAKQRLLALTPQTYCGLAAALTHAITGENKKSK